MQNFMGYDFNSELFQDITHNDFIPMMNCLNANIKKFNKNDIILMADDKITFVGIIASGKVKVVKEDIIGNSSLLTEIESGGIFGEAIVCMGITKSPVTVFAVVESYVVFIDFNKIINTCSNNCSFHSTLIKNMLKIIAKKTVEQNLKIEILSKKGIREKVKAYLINEANKNNSMNFEIPFNRTLLAEFLCTDRSALSKELCKMRDEGLIKFNKNKFEILN